MKGWKIHLGFFIVIIIVATGNAYGQERQLISGTFSRMYYDSRAKKIILINGGNDRGPWHTRNIELWEWVDNNWKLLSDSGPPVRNFFAQAFDETRAVLVLFGGHMQTGRNSFDRYEDTWEWDGKQWKNIVTTENPGNREASKMIYDPGTSSCILFGGCNDKLELLNDTWTYNGSGWKKIHADGPSPRFAATLFYFPVDRKVYLYGGHSPSPTGFLNHADTWELGPAGWTEKVKTSLPGVRLTTETIYNDKTKTIWMIGGDDEKPDRQMLDDIWYFNGKEWTKSGISGFPKRSFHSVIYDLQNNKIIMHGGVSYGGNPALNDTWLFDGAGWKCVMACN